MWLPTKGAPQEWNFHQGCAWNRQPPKSTSNQPFTDSIPKKNKFVTIFRQAFQHINIFKKSPLGPQTFWFWAERQMSWTTRHPRKFLYRYLNGWIEYIIVKMEHTDTNGPRGGPLHQDNEKQKLMSKPCTLVGRTISGPAPRYKVFLCGCKLKIGIFCERNMFFVLIVAAIGVWYICVYLHGFDTILGNLNSHPSLTRSKKSSMNGCYEVL